MFNHLTQKVSYSRNVKFYEQEIERSSVEEEESAPYPLILDIPDELDQEENDDEEGADSSAGSPATEDPPKRSKRERRPVDY